MLWEGLIRARDDGLTRDIGVSNYSTDQIEELCFRRLRIGGRGIPLRCRPLNQRCQDSDG